jgi:hypothetical protein
MGPMGMDTVPGSEDVAGGRFSSLVINGTVGRGRGRNFGPVGSVVSALDIIVDRGEVLIDSLTRHNYAVLDDERGQ